MDRKRVAICYYGLASTINEKTESTLHKLPVNYLSTYQSQLDNLILPNNADVFVHTWSVNVKNDIIDKFKPKSFIFENQIDFTEDANVINDNKDVTHFIQRKYILSRWYSTKQVLELKSKYEKENNFKYDAVMVTRFDCIYNTIWDLINLDMNYFYITGNWPLDYTEGLPDLWFFSNSEIMDIYGKMFNELKDVWYENKYDNRNNEWDGHMLIRRHLARNGIMDVAKLYKQHYIDSDIYRG